MLRSGCSCCRCCASHANGRTCAAALSQVWDFQFLSLEGVVTPSLSGAEVLSVLFVEPYPLLIAGEQCVFSPCAVTDRCDGTLY
jgi:hypothetical protein